MSPEQIILSVAGLVVAIGSIGMGLFKLYRLFRRIDDAIGIDKTGRTLSDRMERVEHQLWENGGSSLADRVNRIETLTIETSSQVKLIKEFLVPTPVNVEVPKTTRRKRTT